MENIQGAVVEVHEGKDEEAKGEVEEEEEEGEAVQEGLKLLVDISSREQAR